MHPDIDEETKLLRSISRGIRWLVVINVIALLFLFLMG